MNILAIIQTLHWLPSVQGSGFHPQNPSWPWTHIPLQDCFFHYAPLQQLCSSRQSLPDVPPCINNIRRAVLDWTKGPFSPTFCLQSGQPTTSRKPTSRTTTTASPCLCCPATALKKHTASGTVPCSHCSLIL